MIVHSLKLSAWSPLLPPLLQLHVRTHGWVRDRVRNGSVHGSSCAVCLCEFVVPSHDKKITEHVRGQWHRYAAQHAYRLLHHRAATEPSLQFLATRGFNLGMLGYGATELEHLRAHGFDVEQANLAALREYALRRRLAFRPQGPFAVRVRQQERRWSMDACGRDFLRRAHALPQTETIGVCSSVESRTRTARL